MKRVERTNAVMIYLNKWAGFAPQWNPYTMEVDRGNRNYYNCGDFGYLARNCRSRGTNGRIGKDRRLEYGNGNNGQKKMIEGGNKQNNNLNRKEDLIVLTRSQ